MVQGQRCDHHFLAFFNLIFQHRANLGQVSHQVGVGQHGTLGYAGCTAGILQCSQVIQLDVDRGELLASTGAEYGWQLVGTGDVERRYHFLQVLNRSVHQGTLER